MQSWPWHQICRADEPDAQVSFKLQLCGSATKSDIDNSVVTQSVTPIAAQAIPEIIPDFGTEEALYRLFKHQKLIRRCRIKLSALLKTQNNHHQLYRQRRLKGRKKQPAGIVTIGLLPRFNDQSTWPKAEACQPRSNALALYLSVSKPLMAIGAGAAFNIQSNYRLCRQGWHKTCGNA